MSRGAPGLHAVLTNAFNPDAEIGRGMRGTGTGEANAWDAILLMQMGGPATLDEVEPFLAALFGDSDIIRLPKAVRPFQASLGRMIAKRRAPKVAPRYEAMGGGSPLQRITREQADVLQKTTGVPVHVAMRYTKPWAHDAIRELQRDHARRVLLLPLYPHYSISTTQSNLKDFARHARDAELVADLRYVRDWGMHPAYLDLIARTCQDARTRLASRTQETPDLLFTAHGVPERYVKVEGDTYQREVEATAAAARDRLAPHFRRVEQGYQSGLGPVKWLGPETGGIIARLAAEGTRGIVLSPLGFVSDHIETMYDMDTLFAGIAKEHGVPYERVPSFNASEDFAHVLAEIAAGPTTPFEVSAWTS